MVDYNTPKIPHNKNLIFDLSTNPFIQQNKTTYTQFFKEITPFENLTEIKNDQNFLDTLKFTVNKIKKNYTEKEINSSYIIQNEIFESICLT